MYHLSSLFTWLSVARGFDKATPWQPQQDSQTDVTTDAVMPTHDGVYCLNCQQRVADTDAAMAMLGAHQHQFTNPHGISFTILLYAKTACMVSGPLTHEFSWFAGYAWQLASCPQCQTQLGWRYRAQHSPDFYGLIKQRLFIQEK